MTEHTRIRTGEHTKVVIMASLSLAISSVCIVLFRGPVSILSAFAVPATLVLFSRGYGRLYPVLVSLGLLLISLMLFQTQIVFAASYLAMALAIRLLLLDAEMNLSVGLGRGLLFQAIVALLLFAGLWLTEKLFLIPLHTMMLRISGGRAEIYVLLLVLEALLISACNILLLKGFLKRISRTLS